MKKLLLLLLILVVIPVYAKENKLYLVEEDKSIKYESGLYDEKVFLKHTDMVPGSSYTDELVIENGTDVAYKLYLRANKKGQSVDAEKLLDSITLVMTLDGREIYRGKANGMGNIILTDSVLLGEFEPNKSSVLKVETYLSVEYENPTGDDYSYVDWTFYAQIDDDEPPEEVVPITGHNKSTTFIVISLLLLIGAFILFSVNNKKNVKKAS